MTFSEIVQLSTVAVVLRDEAGRRQKAGRGVLPRFKRGRGRWFFSVDPAQKVLEAWSEILTQFIGAVPIPHLDKAGLLARTKFSLGSEYGLSDVHAAKAVARAIFVADRSTVHQQHAVELKAVGVTHRMAQLIGDQPSEHELAPFLVVLCHIPGGDTRTWWWRFEVWWRKLHEQQHNPGEPSKDRKKMSYDLRSLSSRHLARLKRERAVLARSA
ncbi:MAG: hypothetical protein JO138_07260 [Acidobacteriaceae bacterium]|nr:hypothetical protein [Acidobacteriaceae bacterium]